jgi:hypothetical protein
MKDERNDERLLSASENLVIGNCVSEMGKKAGAGMELLDLSLHP